MQTYNNRSEVPEEFKWDLTKCFKSEKEYNDLYDETLKLLEQLVAKKGNIAKDAKSLWEFMELDDKLELNLELLYVYSYLFHYENTNDEEGKKLKDRADRLNEKIALETSFVNSELLSESYEYIQKLIKEDKRLEKYAFMLERIFRYKEHTLSEEEEKIISLASNAFGTGDEAFSALDNADVCFEDVNIDGRKEKLSHSNFIKLLGNKNQSVRKHVFETYYKYFKNHKNTITELYKGQIKEDFFFSKVRKFNSPLEKSLFANNIDVSVYKNLINTIRNNIVSMYDYLDFRKKFLKVDELHMYDVYVDLCESESRKFTYEEAKNIVLDAVKPLGEEYVKDLSYLFDNRCIDVYPNDGKRSGAYQWGSYGINPYVSLNFEGTENSVSTLAHELGHAMHSYYSDKNQEHIYAQYPIFLAEIASTVNEVLLNDYMIKNSKNNEEKLLYITSFLDEFRTTVYRQTMFAEFEMAIHDKYQNDEPLTTESICDLYYNLNKYYYGNNVESDDLIRYEWSRIPHFYTPFYVYQYATGFCAALAIASDILAGNESAKENYLKFLSSGSSDYPLEILKKCGVDMTTSETINKGIEMFNEKLELAKQIIEGDR